jgi:subtilisin family serine protease
MFKATTGAGILLAMTLGQSAATAQPRKVVHSIDDLPRFTYPLRGSVNDILTAPPEAFEKTVEPMRVDIDRVLASYDIADGATLRMLLGAKLGAEIASGKEDKLALETIAAIRAHQEKAESRLIAGLAPQAFLEARIAGGEPPGVCPKAFQATYAHHLDALPWSVVGVAETRLKGMVQLASSSFMVGMVAPDIQPILDQSHALSSGPAWQMMAARTNIDAIVTCRDQIAAATNAYIRSHAVEKSDIWSAREAVLPAGVKLTPVRVAIWDSGFDSSLFPGQLLLAPDKRPVAGPAYDVDSRPTTDKLIPITPEQKAAYPQAIADAHGISDLQNGVDSSAADAFRKRIATMSPTQMQSFMQTNSALESFMHGTHVAGIAAAGDPEIRMVSSLMTYDTKPVPTPPTDQTVQREAASYKETVAWFRTHGVRVVNMSWWNRPSSDEAVLEQNGIGKTADERKLMARHLFGIERDGLEAALKSAPDILFVTIAGNNNSDNAFEETIPSSFRLPNLLVVGAVDQAGQQTNFTSTGQNIGVYANGYEVESVVPGGAKVRMSGTSMAAPEVTNLAAKILAVNPKLTPEQVIALITRTADAGETPTILRINPKLAIANALTSSKAEGRNTAGGIRKCDFRCNKPSTRHEVQLL